MDWRNWSGMCRQLGIEPSIPRMEGKQTLNPPAGPGVPPRRGRGGRRGGRRGTGEACHNV